MKIVELTEKQLAMLKVLVANEHDESFNDQEDQTKYRVELLDIYHAFTHAEDEFRIKES